MSEGGGSESDDSMNSRANRDWEIVSLTSSTCAENGSNGVCKEIMEGLDSDTFIFPPSRHEGLPIESEDHYGIESPLLCSENLNENISENEEEAPLVGPEFEPPRAEEENSGNFDELRDSGVSGEENRVSEAEENVELKHESFGNEGWADESFGDEGFRGDGWWKRQAVALGQPNTLWSIAVATALLGIVFLGQRWQHERWNNKQLNLQLCAKDEKISELLYQVSRLKEVASGRRKVTVVRNGSL